MSSVDGRLLNDRWTPPFDGTPASKQLEVYAALGRELNTDAWMFGKNTLRAVFPYKWGIDGHAVSSDSPAVFVGERRSERMFIVPDPETGKRMPSGFGRNTLPVKIELLTENIVKGRNRLRSTFAMLFVEQ